MSGDAATIPCLGIRGCTCGKRHYLAYEFGAPGAMREVPTFTDLVIKLARYYGLAVMHVPDSRRVGMPGWPDLTIKGPHSIIYRELKRDAGTLDPEQRAIGSLLTAGGADWQVWRPVNLYSGLIEQTLWRMA